MTQHHNHGEPHGLILRCDSSGTVQEIVQDGIGIELVPPFLFTRLIDHHTMGKALSFLAELNTNNRALDWELVLYNAPRVLHFSGIRTENHLYIIASENNQETQQLFEELMKITNEQATMIRRYVKREAEELSLYEEISRLNNELVTVQRELAKKNAELEFLNMEKNRFLGMAAHDLRNPLHGILLQCDYLASVITDPAHLEIIRAIQDASNFMVSLIEDLLDYSKIETGSVNLDYTKVDVVKLVEDIVRINKTLAARYGISLLFSPEPMEPVYTDSGKISQILNNLISNAIKFSTEGKEILVTLRNQAQYYELAVADQGKGMSEEQQQQLFKPFHRGERGLHGEKTTGLGLTIVKRIIDALGGTIAVESKEGSGTTFTVRLPKIPPELQSGRAS
ncbi:MAG TPA: HAMP domain-containing sensor histidine kinase [Termitinemataceae bacterium]|nr:HAMP domain-containing sensor histidine kinase [Termitinemataceae bacterium]HOM23833.1 HAMP domain-containing sensor histidine kinase [Termitinemataceae bacterium]HPP99903.1 HAMP domain-containing sensor histidine kinase [Termitinemataceae bacterium]